MNKEQLISKIIPILERYPIKRASIFGSYARNEQTTVSDVDILVDFFAPIGLGFGSLYLDLKEALPIEPGLLTRSGLNEQSSVFKELVAKEEEVFYAK